MTKAQFIKKVDVAIKSGMAFMPDGCALIYHGNMYFSVYDRDGNCVDVSKSGATKLFYLFES